MKGRQGTLVTLIKSGTLCIFTLFDPKPRLEREWHHICLSMLKLLHSLWRLTRAARCLQTLQINRAYVMKRGWINGWCDVAWNLPRGHSEVDLFDGLYYLYPLFRVFTDSADFVMFSLSIEGSCTSQCTVTTIWCHFILILMYTPNACSEDNTFSSKLLYFLQTSERCQQGTRLYNRSKSLTVLDTQRVICINLL